MLVAQSYLILCDPMDCSLPGSSVCGILQARILEWVAIPSFKILFGLSLHIVPWAILWNFWNILEYNLKLLNLVQNLYLGFRRVPFSQSVYSIQLFHSCKFLCALTSIMFSAQYAVRPPFSFFKSYSYLQCNSVIASSLNIWMLFSR